MYMHITLTLEPKSTIKLRNYTKQKTSFHRAKPQLKIIEIYINKNVLKETDKINFVYIQDKQKFQSLTLVIVDEQKHHCRPLQTMPNVNTAKI